MSPAEDRRRRQVLASIGIDAKELRAVLVFATDPKRWRNRYDGCEACKEGDVLDMSHHRKTCPVRIAGALRKVVP